MTRLPGQDGAGGAVRAGEEDVMGFTGDDTASVSRQFEGIAGVNTRYSPEGQSYLPVSWKTPVGRVSDSFATVRPFGKTAAIQKRMIDNSDIDRSSHFTER